MSVQFSYVDLYAPLHNKQQLIKSHTLHSSHKN